MLLLLSTLLLVTLSKFNMNLRKIVEEAVREVKQELKVGEVEIDIVEIVEGAVQSTGVDLEKIGEEGVKKIAKESAKAALSKVV